MPAVTRRHRPSRTWEVACNGRMSVLDPGWVPTGIIYCQGDERGPELSAHSGGKATAHVALHVGSSREYWLRIGYGRKNEGWNGDKDTRKQLIGLEMEIGGRA
jgi:hypothetical protein